MALTAQAFFVEGPSKRSIAYWRISDPRYLHQLHTRIMLIPLDKVAQISFLYPKKFRISN